MKEERKLEIEFTEAEELRYSRNQLLPEIGLHGQEKLKAAKVLIVGLGGLGSPVALYLGAAGVGVIGLADNDVIEVHNLQRQVLHDTASIQEPKIVSAHRRLEGLNPHCQYKLHPEGITPENALSILSEYDIIVDCTDNFPTRYLLNDAAYLLKKTLVHGSISQWDGQITVYEAHLGTPCYRCLFPEMPKAGEVPNCSETGVMGALCGVVGSLQAIEVIKKITGAGELLTGGVLSINTLSQRNTKIAICKEPSCPLCGMQPAIKNIASDNYRFECARNVEEMSEAINGFELEKLLSEDPSGVCLLDVRETHEVAICKLKGSLHIPMNEVGNRLRELGKDEKIVVYCHHGGRSLYITKLLRSEGFTRAINLTGGIDEWAIRIDKSLKRY